MGLVPIQASSGTLRSTMVSGFTFVRYCVIFFAEKEIVRLCEARVHAT